MLAKPSLADPWELWCFRAVSLLPIHKTLGKGCPEQDMTGDRWFSSAAAIPKGKGDSCGSPAASTPAAGATVRGDGQRFPVLITGPGPGSKITWLRELSLHSVEGERGGHKPLYNTVITVIEVSLKCQHGLVCRKDYYLCILMQKGLFTITWLSK